MLLKDLFQVHSPCELKMNICKKLSVANVAVLCQSPGVEIHLSRYSYRLVWQSVTPKILDRFKKFKH